MSVVHDPRPLPTGGNVPIAKRHQLLKQAELMLETGYGHKRIEKRLHTTFRYLRKWAAQRGSPDCPKVQIVCMKYRPNSQCTLTKQTTND